VLAELDLAALVADIGPLPFAGSFVSGLMCWRELDAMVLVGGDFSPQDVLRLLAGIVDQTGLHLSSTTRAGPSVRDRPDPRALSRALRRGPDGQVLADRADAVAARCAPQCHVLARRAARAHYCRAAQRGAAHQRRLAPAANLSGSGRWPRHLIAVIDDGAPRASSLPGLPTTGCPPGSSTRPANSGGMRLRTVCTGRRWGPARSDKDLPYP
jgi:hypothetical protein